MAFYSHKPPPSLVSVITNFFFHLWFLLSLLTLVISKQFLQVILPPLLVSLTIPAAVPTFSPFSCTDPQPRKLPWVKASLWASLLLPLASFLDRRGQRSIYALMLHPRASSQETGGLRQALKGTDYCEYWCKIWRTSPGNASSYLLIPQGKFLGWSEHKSGILHMLCFCLSCLGTVRLRRL